MSVVHVLVFAGVTVGVGLLVIITTAIIAVIVGCIIMKSRQGMKTAQLAYTDGTCTACCYSVHY